MNRDGSCLCNFLVKFLFVLTKNCPFGTDRKPKIIRFDLRALHYQLRKSTVDEFLESDENIWRAANSFDCGAIWSLKRFFFKSVFAQ